MHSAVRRSARADKAGRLTAFSEQTSSVAKGANPSEAVPVVIDRQALAVATLRAIAAR